MRANGVCESLCTGDGSDYDKFLAFASTMRYAIGNPLYHWSHLELKRYFGIDEVLSEQSAQGIWKRVNAILAGGLRCRDFIKLSNVEVICTTDDPADSLEHHLALRDENLSFRVLPTWRPDKIRHLNDPAYPEYVSRLAASAGSRIQSLDELKTVLVSRLDYFEAAGCRLSDHSFEYMPLRDSTADPAGVFAAALSGKPVSLQEESAFTFHIMEFLGAEYARRGWTMQLHMGALRSNNTRMLRAVGADTGFDSINDFALAERLAEFMDSLDSKELLPQTILYHVNPSFNYVLGSMIGNFQGESPGKIQFGSAWWFCDHFDGMRRQLTDLAALGLLGRFVGMLTDSRSFLSYTRHEYFRRILCGLLGEWVTAGHLPNDMDTLGETVSDICYHNAKAYFKL
jgi:glucuronate isomerase